MSTGSLCSMADYEPDDFEMVNKLGEGYFRNVSEIFAKKLKSGRNRKTGVMLFFESYLIEITNPIKKFSFVKFYQISLLIIWLETNFKVDPGKTFRFISLHI